MAEAVRVVQEEIDLERKARGLRPRKLRSKDKVRIQVTCTAGVALCHSEEVAGRQLSVVHVPTGRQWGVAEVLPD